MDKVNGDTLSKQREYVVPLIALASVCFLVQTFMKPEHIAFLVAGDILLLASLIATLFIHKFNTKKLAIFFVCLILSVGIGFAISILL